jgi:hypothetical protein
MMRYGALMAAIAAWAVLWQECGENPALFCYRIGMDAFMGIRARAMVLAPAINFSARNNFRCSNRSAICSTLFTTSKE